MIGNGPRITVVVKEDQNENTMISNKLMVLKTIRVVYEHFNVHTSMMQGGKPLDNG